MITPETVYYKDGDFEITYEEILKFKADAEKFKENNEKKYGYICALMEDNSSFYYQRIINNTRNRQKDLINDLKKYINDNYDVYISETKDNYYVIRNPILEKIPTLEKAETELNKIKNSYFYKLVGRFFV